MNQRTEELKNTIKIPKGELVEYDLVPSGLHTFGLVLIKNTQKKAFKSDEMQDAYRFVFRHKELTAGYVFFTCTSSFHERSNLYKSLKAMAGPELKPDMGEAELFGLMKSLIGRWFDIMVEHNTAENGKVYANIVKGAIMPNKTMQGSCLDYFNGKNIQQIKANNKPEEPNEFDAYKDGALAEKVEEHFYDLSTCVKDKLPAARQILIKAGAVKTDPDGIMFTSPVECPKLAKFKVLPIEKDDVPF
jgi:hypothetical protein